MWILYIGEATKIDTFQHSTHTYTHTLPQHSIFTGVLSVVPSHVTQPTLKNRINEAFCNYASSHCQQRF